MDGNRKLNSKQIKAIPVELPVIPPKNSFILGDCMDYLPLFPPNFFDLAIVDPPYGMDKSSTNGAGKLKHRALNRLNTDWDKSPPDEYFKQLFRVSSNQIIWGGNYFNLPPTRGFIIWDKKQFLPTFSRCEYAWTSYYKPAKMFEWDNASTDKIHPTQKPVELYKWILRDYAKAGDLILDTHVGSASSLIACTELGFDYIGFEKDEEYYTMAKSRLGRATRKYELFEAV